jgi:hypothetical protein
MVHARNRQIERFHFQPVTALQVYKQRNNAQSLFRVRRIHGDNQIRTLLEPLTPQAFNAFRSGP